MSVRTPNISYNYKYALGSFVKVLKACFIKGNAHISEMQVLFLTYFFPGQHFRNILRHMFPMGK